MKNVEQKKIPLDIFSSITKKEKISNISTFLYSTFFHRLNLPTNPPNTLKVGEAGEASVAQKNGSEYFQIQNSHFAVLEMGR